MPNHPFAVPSSGTFPAAEQNVWLLPSGPAADTQTALGPPLPHPYPDKRRGGRSLDRPPRLFHSWPPVL